MIVGSLFGIALQALTANKLRSGLTLLGIVFGVTSIMTIISALEGMQDSIEESFSALGPSTFMVARIMIITSDEMFWEKIKRKPVLIEDADLIKERCSLVDKVSPRAFGNAILKYGSQSMRNVNVMGGRSNFLDIVDFQLEQGRFHSEEDDLHKRKVIFIGDLVREEFFEGVDPLGKTLKVNGKKYNVIGVAKKQGTMFGQSRDNFVVIPLSTHTQQFGRTRRGANIVVKAVSVERLDDAMDQVRLALRTKRKVPYNSPDDFDMLTAAGLLDVLNNITRMARMGLIGISAISLVVGGIVVMNIMMVSVSERTREIGIRRSLGAKQSHIMAQFMFESVVLTLTGGLIGTAAGFLIAKALVAQIDMDISLSMVAIFWGLSISTGIGLFFGIYPAMKAAKLDPVKALGHE